MAGLGGTDRHARPTRLCALGCAPHSGFQLQLVGSFGSVPSLGVAAPVRARGAQTTTIERESVWPQRRRPPSRSPMDALARRVGVSTRLPGLPGLPPPPQRLVYRIA